MTVAALAASASYVENGVTVAFPAPFRFKAASDLVVDRIFPGGTVIPLALGVDYTVAGGTTDAGGTLTRLAATSGATLRIRRRTARAQPMVYTPGDRFPAKSHEDALDRGILIAQEQDDQLRDIGSRAALVPVGETADPLPAASLRAQRLLGFDVGGRPQATVFTQDQLASVLGAIFNPSFTQLGDLVLFLAAGASAVVRTLQDKGRERVSVRDHGAIGDGVSRALSARFTTLAAAQVVYPFVTSLAQTQDWAGIQAAIRYCESLSVPAELEIPRGSYLCSDQIDVTRGLKITGDGPTNSILIYNGSINCFNVALAAGEVGFCLEHVGILNQMAIGSVTGGTAIRLNPAGYTRLNNIQITNFYFAVNSTNANLSVFKDITVNGFKDTAFRLTGGNFDIRFYNCVASGNGVGVFALYMSDFNDEHMFVGFVTNGCTYAVYATSAIYSVNQRPEWCKFYNASLDSCANGIVLENCSDFVFDSCFISCRPGNGAEIGIAKPTDGVTFARCTFFNNGGQGARLGAFAVNTTFDSCNFVSNSQANPGVGNGLDVSDNTTKFVVMACKFHNAWYPTSIQNIGLSISGAGCDNFSVVGNIFGAAQGQTFVNNSTGTDQHVVGNVGLPATTDLSGSAVYDPPSIVDGAGGTTAVTVNGAALGDYVTGVSFSNDLQGITLTAWVSSANTVSVRFQNETGAPVDLASGTLRVRVAKA